MGLLGDPQGSLSNEPWVAGQGRGPVPLPRRCHPANLRSPAETGRPRRPGRPTIVHETKTSTAVQQISIAANENAYIEYLPDPLVMFPGARLSSRIKIVAADSATVMVTDSFLAHDPNATGGVFDQLANELVVETPEGRLRCLDRFEITGEQLASDDRFSAHGTFVCIDESLGEEARLSINQTLSEIPGIYAGISTLPDGAGLWWRLLASDSQALRDGLNTAWRALRQLKTGLVPHLRRK